MKGIKKLAVLMMCVAMLTGSVLSVSAAGVMPRYNNVGYVNATASVSSNGVLYVDYNYTANSNMTSVEINTLVEKQTLFLFWSDVAEWSDTISQISYTDTDTLQLDDEGKYRITVEYTFYGTGGAADTITYEMEVEY
ncbi:MAG: hypothetical protein J6B39_08975 [Lachnospiraceae bacterium]|nr:hypothetical protein [Lachnospiraceae bacterium]